MKLNKDCKRIPNNKNDRDYKYYVTSCLTKKAYDTREEAIKVAQICGKKWKTSIDIYRCQFCCKFHLTTNVRDAHSGANHNFHATNKNGNLRKEVKKRYRIVDDNED